MSTGDCVTIAAREYFRSAGHTVFTAKAFYRGSTYVLPCQNGRGNLTIAAAVFAAIAATGVDITDAGYVIDVATVTRQRDLHALPSNDRGVWVSDTYCAPAPALSSLN